MAPLGTTERTPQTLRPPAEPVATPSRATTPAWPEPGIGEAKGPRPRKTPWKKIMILLVIAGAAVGAYATYQRIAHPKQLKDVQLFTVTARSFPVILKERGELKANNSIDIRSEIEGRATIIYLIPEGSRVKEGELLIELASDEIDNNIRDNESKEATALAAYEASVKTRDIQRDENASKIRKAELQLKLATLAEEKYIKGEQRELEQDATLAVDKAQMVLDREEQDYKDSQELFDEGFITRVELNDAKFNAYAAKLDLEKARLGLEVLNKYTVPMALEEKRSDVREAEKELERERKAAEAAEAKATADVDARKSELDIVRDKLSKLRDQKKKSKILAPAAGLVVYARENSHRTETIIDSGVQVYERQLLVQLPDVTQMKVEARVHEAQIERLAVGMPATVAIEGFANRMFTGKVARIAVMADSQNYWLNPNLREYKTDILLDGTFSELKPNTTCRVEIQLAQLNNVLAVPVQSVFAKAGRFYVFLDEAGKTRPVPVEPGMASTDFVEIKSGLKAGQTIRLAVTEQMQLLLPSEAAEGSEADADGGAARRRAASVETALPASRPAGARPGGGQRSNRPAEGGASPTRREGGGQAGSRDTGGDATRGETGSGSGRRERGAPGGGAPSDGASKSDSAPGNSGVKSDGAPGNGATPRAAQ